MSPTTPMPNDTGSLSFLLGVVRQLQSMHSANTTVHANMQMRVDAMMELESAVPMLVRNPLQLLAWERVYVTHSHDTQICSETEFDACISAGVSR